MTVYNSINHNVVQWRGTMACDISDSRINTFLVLRTQNFYSKNTINNSNLNIYR